ncbi:polyamine transporter 3 [Colletotrichum truncatum]|uniref:Polyamine transporter 3 n=1 Tax=Colletotrichum truncatum TaxID=5467 RepID=A0ACC3YDD9_COLTU|nr:polyamine transporter 3 [Colletotrichum truncatum]KAF6784785.1 polyamine transporter 3 [Colletotrichum truncatum]
MSNVTVENVDPTLIDWDGPNDPENPQNWPKSRKFVNLALMSILTIISPLGSSMFAPGVPDLMTEFETDSSILATFVVSIYFLGFAFGPLVVAPLSEIYGRVYVYHTGNISFTVFSVGAALSINVNMLMTFRFLMGVVGSVPTTIGVGSIIDVMPLESRGRALSIWALGPLLGPSLGPVIGGFLIERAGWRWVYWLLAILGGAFAVLALIVMRETYAPVLLQRKTQALRELTGDSTLRSKLDVHGSKRLKMALIRPLKFLLATPLVTIIASYIGILYGTSYLLITTFSFVYAGQYGFGKGVIGLTFLPSGLGMMVGVLTFGHIQDFLVKRSKRNMQPGEVYRPEIKLTPWLTLPLSIIPPIGLLLYGWTTQYKVFFIVPMIGVFLFSFSLSGLTMTVQNYQMDSYPRYAASASAAVMLSRSLIGALMPLGGLKMYDTLGLGWGNSLLAFLSLALIPIPLLLFSFGERIRQRFDPVL